MTKEKKTKAKDTRRVKIQDGEPFLVAAKNGAGCEVESECNIEDLPVIGRYVLLHILDTLIENSDKPEVSPAEIASVNLCSMVKDVLMVLEKKYSEVGTQQYLN